MLVVVVVVVVKTILKIIKLIIASHAFKASIKKVNKPTHHNENILKSCAENTDSRLVWG